MNSIIEICEQYNITNYTINNDGTIDVNGDVYLRYEGLTELPLTFNRVDGYFNCGDNFLTRLKGSPKWVGGSFYCYNNRLTSLEGSPEYVTLDVDCSSNRLTSLRFGPEKIGKDFLTYNNKLTDNYCDTEIGGDFYTSLKQDGLEIKFTRCLNYNEWRKLYRRKLTLNKIMDL
jgi:hypothetical protein